MSMVGFYFLHWWGWTTIQTLGGNGSDPFIGDDKKRALQIEH
jgi:hypothetical protein